MNNGTAVVVTALGVVAAAAAAAPWVVGWRAENLVRQRVAQVDADRDARFRLRIERYERGYAGSTATLVIADRSGAPRVTLPATIRHWPWTPGGPAEWTATPKLAPSVQEMLGPWGSQLPALTATTRLAWNGDALTRIESPSLQRRIPEVAGGTLDIGALAGTIDWRRDGALDYDFALPHLRLERRPLGRTDAPDVIEFTAATLRGSGNAGGTQRRWAQKVSVAATAIRASEAGVPTLAARDPRSEFSVNEDGDFAGVHFAFAADAITARTAWQNLNDAAIEITFDAKHLAKDALARYADAMAGAPAERSRAAAAAAGRAERELMDGLLRGSPALDAKLAFKAREGRAALRAAIAFDGSGYDTTSRGAGWLDRIDVEVELRASESLVQSGARAGADIAGLPLGPAAGAPGAEPGKSQDPARRHLADLAARGWIRVEGEEIAATLVWRAGRLSINGQDVETLRDAARGLAGR